MDPERWRRIQELFDAASARPESERAAFLDERCAGDSGLRREVASLLDSSSHAESVLEGAVRGGFELFDAAASKPRIGKYEILEKIGQGGFGTVYKGRDALLDRTVAVKTCTTDNEDLRKRFFREGRIAANLQHPNVTTIHDFGLEGEVPYLVQEFLTGCDLSDLLAADRLSTVEKVDVLVQMARGLEYAHRAGVLHRDVKPSNVRVLENGTVKLMDFGIARLLSGADTKLTGTGMTIGTVGYLAPEQLKGGEVGARADMFSFGVVAYEMFTGVRPFQGETFSQVSYQLLYEEPVALASRWPECPDRRIVEVVERCLEKEEPARYASMSEVVEQLEAVLATGIRSVRTSAIDATLEMPIPDSGELTRLEVAAAAPSTLAEREPRRRLWERPEVRAALAAIVVAGVAWSLLRGSEEPEPAADRGIESPSAPAPAETPEPEPGGGLEPEKDSRPPVDPGIRDEPDAAAQEDSRSQAEPAVDPPAARPEPSPPSPSASPPPTSPPPAASPPPVAVPVAMAPPPPADPPVAPPPPVTLPPPPVTLPPSPPAPDVAESPPGTPSIRPMKLGQRIDASEPGVMPPEVVKAVAPRYPRKARRWRAQARVVVAVYVDENGRVLQAIVKTPDNSGYGFNEEALEAARKTTFRPATRDGIAGKMWTEIPYDFSLDR